MPMFQQGANDRAKLLPAASAGDLPAAAAPSSGIRPQTKQSAAKRGSSKKQPGFVGDLLDFCNDRPPAGSAQSTPVMDALVAPGSEEPTARDNEPDLAARLAVSRETSTASTHSHAISAPGDSPHERDDWSARVASDAAANSACNPEVRQLDKSSGLHTIRDQSSGDAVGATAAGGPRDACVSAQTDLAPVANPSSPATDKTKPLAMTLPTMRVTFSVNAPPFWMSATLDADHAASYRDAEQLDDLATTKSANVAMPGRPLVPDEVAVSPRACASSRTLPRETDTQVNSCSPGVRDSQSGSTAAGGSCSGPSTDRLAESGPVVANGMLLLEGGANGAETLDRIAQKLKERQRGRKHFEFGLSCYEIARSADDKSDLPHAAYTAPSTTISQPAIGRRCGCSGLSQTTRRSTSRNWC